MGRHSSWSLSSSSSTFQVQGNPPGNANRNSLAGGCSHGSELLRTEGQGDEGQGEAGGGPTEVVGQPQTRRGTGLERQGPTVTCMGGGMGSGLAFRLLWQSARTSQNALNVPESWDRVTDRVQFCQWFWERSCAGESRQSCPWGPE